ncbi:hypothetical protein BIY24_05555 [Halobacteriovorax marinus]|uniref:patatin-like phospholipase family protein n=1 Tax=Halobacteriovorax marinus TaxID=97084 RepID=UPI000BC326F6|nr:patatin-like phospholipase family protein [Halobacteriovorax marinus]ATH07424.1 hypothetical protein BIY24_05555 [Halobacteriovorax marinus]
MKTVLILSFFLILLSNSAHAKTAITTSGGVSLGSYKGGFLYYLTEFIKSNPKHVQISHMAGASAGGINAIFAVDTLCSKKSFSKEESLFWKVWVNTGVNQLFDPEKVTPLSVFHREGMDPYINELKERFKNGYSKDCNLTIGIPVTSKHPFNMIDHEKVYFPSLRNFFVFTISGNGEGKPVSFRNRIIKGTTKNQLQLPFSDDFNQNYDLIKKVMYATSAFPVAFAPVKIPTCKKSESNCSAENSQESTFFDGGVFDNNPFSLTNQIAELLYPKTYKKFEYYYLNSSNHAFKELDTSSINVEEKENLSSMIANSLSDLIAVSRMSEEATFLKDNLDVIERSIVPTTLLPPMSSPLYAFMGFYDIDFRKFDYELGMNDAREFVKKKYKSKDIRFPSLNNAALHNCFEMIRKSSKEAIDKCEENFPELDENLQKIFQLEIFRAHRFCKNLNDKEGRFKDLCKFYGLSDQAYTIIPNLPKGLDTPTKDSEGEESEVNYILRVLDTLKFKYTDLNLNSSFHVDGVEKVYLSQRRMLNAFKRKQPSQEAAMIGVLETYLLQNLDYIPPSDLLYFNFGNTLEVGIKKNYPTFSKSVNFQASFYFLDYYTFLGSEADNIAISPTIGVSISPRIFHHDNYRLSLGIQLGYQFSSRDGYGGEDCSISDYRVKGSYCSGDLAILYVAAGIFDRVNLKFGYMIHKEIGPVLDAKTGFLMIGYNFF